MHTGAMCPGAAPPDPGRQERSSDGLSRGTLEGSGSGVELGQTLVHHKDAALCHRTLLPLSSSSSLPGYTQVSRGSRAAFRGAHSPRTRVASGRLCDESVFSQTPFHRKKLGKENVIFRNIGGGRGVASHRWRPHLTRFAIRRL